MELLRRGWPLGEESKYDVNHALVLCRMHGFSPGLLFLYEHMRLFREVLQVSQTRLACLCCRQVVKPFGVLKHLRPTLRIMHVRILAACSKCLCQSLWR